MAAITVLGGAALAFAGVAYLTPGRDEQESDRRIALINLSGGIVIPTVADGVARGLSPHWCRTAFQSAHDLAQGAGQLAYRTEDECLARHGQAMVANERLPALSLAACSMVCMAHNVVYEPPVVAVMALHEDPSVAVPLYALPDRRSGWRRDGVAFPLTA